MTTNSIRVSRLLENGVRRAVRQLQLRAFQALTSATPVDTGFARGGWSPSTGAPDNSSQQGRDSKGRFVRPVDESQARTIAQSEFSKHTQESAKIAASYTLGQGVVFIVNPVSYVEFLNQGSSAQAPSMFVDKAIAVAIEATRKSLGLLG